MKRAFLMIVLLLALAALFLVLFKNVILPVQKSALEAASVYTGHIIGGFSADTPERVSEAAAEGVQVVFKYGEPPAANDSLGQKLQSLHMKVVDGFIASYLYYYECHRTRNTVPLLQWEQYCQSDYDPSLTSENVLLTTIATHLKLVQANPLVIGYWVLDDWVIWNAGSAQHLLVKIHKLIQQYTPGRPAICGFGGLIGIGTTYTWSDWLADNFSPQGCDSVGIYLYTPVLLDTTPAPYPNTYNWSMLGLLPAIFASLERRGWDMRKEPLIGIVQAFGGPRNHTNFYSVTPTAKNIETQSSSFCEHGASGLVFYAWDDSGFGPTAQTPVNNVGIETGIQDGIAACEQYWRAYSKG